MHCQQGCGTPFRLVPVRCHAEYHRPLSLLCARVSGAGIARSAVLSSSALSVMFWYVREMTPEPVRLLELHCSETVCVCSYAGWGL